LTLASVSSVPAKARRPLAHSPMLQKRMYKRGPAKGEAGCRRQRGGAAPGVGTIEPAILGADARDMQIAARALNGAPLKCRRHTGRRAGPGSVAIIHLRLTPLSRASGANAVAAAARQAATVLIDRRSGETYDFSREPGLVHEEIIGPRGAGDWWRDRQSLWNAAEQSEVRRNSRVAREYRLALPHELSAAERIELARHWARYIVERYGCVMDVTVHAPPADGDSRNHYATMLATTRQVTPTGLGEKLGIEQLKGEQSGPKELRLLHQRWRVMIDAALRETNAQLSAPRGP
jgi:hypothetical protein